ncbi:MAG: hypothetical protein ISS69_06690 [Phycisphaerae bacterium]|nr:hypothetical protein [Phycisphaerae bacterium]
MIAHKKVRMGIWCSMLAAAVLVGGCGTSGWRAEKIAVVEGIRIPESLALDRAGGCVYVSNCEGDPSKSWEDDGDGFISRMTPEGKMLDKYWVRSKGGAILNDPKGLAIFNGFLYICDNKRLVRIPLDRSRGVEEVKLNTTEIFCDPLAWGGHLYVGYGGPEKIIFKFARDGKVSRIKGVASINGLAGDDKQLYCVTWATHEIYQIDPAGKTDPIAFGLAEKFVNLDGIDVLSDGTFVVSDFKANRLYTVAPDRKTLKLLVEVDTPADIIIDHQRNLLYAPSYKSQKITIYKLHKTVGK